MRKFRKILTVWLVVTMLFAYTDIATAKGGRLAGDDDYYSDDFNGYDVPDDYADDYGNVDDDFIYGGYDDIGDGYGYYDSDYDDIDDDYYDDDDYDDIDDDYDYDDDDIDDDDDYDYDDDDIDDDYDDDYDDDIDDDYDDDDDTYNNGYNSKKPARKNTVLTVAAKNCKVKVQSSLVGNPTVLYYRATNKKASVITIPEKVTVNKITYKVVGIADSAFAGNKKVKRIVVGRNVLKIGKRAFFGCSNLNQIITRSSSIISVGKNALKNTGKNLVIKSPKEKVVRYKRLFSGKGNSKIRVKAA